MSTEDFDPKREDIYQELLAKIEAIKKSLIYPAPVQTKFNNAIPKMENEEIKEPVEIELYEGYRTYPVSIKHKEGYPVASIDVSFMNTCYDFGRFLAISDYDSTVGFDEARDFIDKFFITDKKIIKNATQYENDIISKQFGLCFINRGFTHWTKPLDNVGIDDVSSDAVEVLRNNGILRY